MTVDGFQNAGHRRKSLIMLSRSDRASQSSRANPRQGSPCRASSARICGLRKTWRLTLVLIAPYALSPLHSPSGTAGCPWACQASRFGVIAVAGVVGGVEAYPRAFCAIKRGNANHGFEDAPLEARGSIAVPRGLQVLILVDSFGECREVIAFTA